MGFQWRIKHWNELTREEVYELIALRTRVFIVEQNCPYLDADGKDKHSYHLFALGKNDECISYLRIVEPGFAYNEWAIGRVCTDLSIRNIGVGKEMMAVAMKWLKEKKGDPAVRLSAQTHLIKFYESFGFISTGKEYLEDGIPHTEMIYSGK